MRSARSTRRRLPSKNSYLKSKAVRSSDNHEQAHKKIQAQFQRGRGGLCLIVDSVTILSCKDMIESPYFYLVVLFVTGYAWHALLVHIQKRKSGSVNRQGDK